MVRDPEIFVNQECEYVDLENFICRFVAVGGKIKNYKDSLCAACLSGLNVLRDGK